MQEEFERKIVKILTICTGRVNEMEIDKILTICVDRVNERKIDKSLTIYEDEVNGENVLAKANFAHIDEKSGNLFPTLCKTMNDSTIQLIADFLKRTARTIVNT